VSDPVDEGAAAAGAGTPGPAMRIDVVSIFPDYLAALDLSLIGKARQDGLLDVRVHDLRDFTHDRHRSVDDTPYGGGAGMVMKPQPWSEALDHVLAQRDSTAGPRLVVPGPGGQPFTQALARELAQEPWLAFACGRYEGIDERVYDHAREDLGLEVSVVSLGDYVLNGGEVAVLAMVEAVGRLLPGVIGNAESLVEESHEDGLLEYPVYTKPASWRGRDVPSVLLSGDHAAIAAWRHDQAVRRTAERRPDLVPASSLLEELEIRPAQLADSGELLVLQLACWVAEQHDNPGVRIPALHETHDDMRAWLARDRVLVARSAGRLVGAVRASLDGESWEIGRLMVAPDLAGRGLGQALLERIEALAPAAATTYALFTGAGSTRNQRIYKKAGYRLRGEIAPGVVRMTKRISRP
jgi:tRNA (guanine37-N1)-methyltransferase